MTLEVGRHVPPRWYGGWFHPEISDSSSDASLGGESADSEGGRKVRIALRAFWLQNRASGMDYHLGGRVFSGTGFEFRARDQRQEEQDKKQMHRFLRLRIATRYSARDDKNRFPVSSFGFLVKNNIKSKTKTCIAPRLRSG